MKTRALRKIVRIDEENCDGCGVCVPACVEGALQIVDGKARLVSETYCDGLGACLGECPMGAITIEEREAEGFDEEATKHHLEASVHDHDEDRLPCGCPSATVTQFDERDAMSSAGEPADQPSMLGHWPVQLTLVPPTAPFLKDADLLLVADCVPFAYGGFHQRFLANRAVLVACPKLDDYQAHQRKLADILRQSRVRSLTVLRMEVPCCFGLTRMAQEAIALSGKDIPLGEVIIGVKGDLKS
jgi:Fe-S-cluster-containing hydrogenase component 2